MTYHLSPRPLIPKRRRANCFLSGLLILTIAAFAACSNNGTADKAVVTQLSKETVSRILGVEFRDPNHQTREDDAGRTVLSSFTFIPRNEAEFSSLNLLVLPRNDGMAPAEAVRRHILSLRQGTSDEDLSLVPVKGIGQAALYDPAMGQLVVIENQRLLVFTLHHQPSEQTLPLLTALAQAALHP